MVALGVELGESQPQGRQLEAAGSGSIPALCPSPSWGFRQISCPGASVSCPQKGAGPPALMRTEDTEGLAFILVQRAAPESILSGANDLCGLGLPPNCRASVSP